MRLLTIQIDLDELPTGLAEIEPTLNRVMATLRLRGIPLVDGMGLTLSGSTGKRVGYFAVHPRKDEK